MLLTVYHLVDESHIDEDLIGLFEIVCVLKVVWFWSGLILVWCGLGLGLVWSWSGLVFV
jgi:hypothetical protein